MKRTACRLFLLGSACILLCGCGTVSSLIEQDYRVYAGVSRDLEAINHGGIIGITAVIDLPLSFVLDTLLLPVTLSQ